MLTKLWKPYPYRHGWGFIILGLFQVHVCPKHIWVYLWKTREWFGVFRNKKDTDPKWPRRWGFHILGLDIGRR